MALSPEEQQYYGDLDETFSTPGWKRIIEAAKQEIYQLQADSLEAPNWDVVNVNRGRAIALAQFVNLEDVSDMQRAELEREDE